MQDYIQVYYDSRGLDKYLDKVYCKRCGCLADDIHHIRGRIGALRLDPYNLVALCRKHHTEAHAHKISKEQLEALVKSEIKNETYT